MVDVIAAAARVTPAAAASDRAIQAHLDDLTKPVGSLGRLEEIARRLARIYGDPPPHLSRRCVLAFAADHGVACEGVSAYPAEVTAQMCGVAAAGRAAINVLADACAATVCIIDVGVDTGTRIADIEYRRVRNGTRNLAVENALAPDEVLHALHVGYDAVRSRISEYEIFAIGEFGIGSSTSAAALTAALLGLEADACCGRGTGVDDAALRRKITVVAGALRRLSQPVDATHALAAVGGLELCAIAGAAIACAEHHCALVTDGFIATAGVLAAVRINPAIADYVFASHLSPEPGHALQLAHIGVEPLFDFGMRLGEGTGAVLALPLLDAAARLLRDMATFSAAAVSGRTERVRAV